MKFGDLHWLAVFGIFFVATAFAIIGANWMVARETERKALKAQQEAQRAAQKAA